MNKKIEQEIGTYMDWKFGLITRTIYRSSENCFEISDMSDGWKTAYVDEETMRLLIDGNMSLTCIQFE